MSLDRQHQVGLVHAMSVVLDADQALSARCRGDRDALCSSIECIFDQFLDDAGRPLDDLAGGNLVDQIVWKLPNGHWC